MTSEGAEPSQSLKLLLAVGWKNLAKTDSKIVLMQNKILSSRGQLGQLGEHSLLNLVICGQFSSKPKMHIVEKKGFSHRWPKIASSVKL